MMGNRDDMVNQMTFIAISLLSCFCLRVSNTAGKHNILTEDAIFETDENFTMKVRILKLSTFPLIVTPNVLSRLGLQNRVRILVKS